MATLVIPNEGELTVANRAWGKTTNSSLTVKLYTNDFTPDEASVVGDLTEATATGYSAQTVDPASITVANNGVSGKAEAVFTATFSGMTAIPDQQIYGVYVVDASGNLVGVGKFDSAKVLNTEATTLTQTMTIVMG
jgi:hypothetical protein